MKLQKYFVLLMNFVKFDQSSSSYILGNTSMRPSRMSKSEVITGYTLFHLSGFSFF